MNTEPPDPPEGVANIHTQPGILQDSELPNILEELRAGELSDGGFDRLTQFEPNAPESPTSRFEDKAIQYLESSAEYRGKLRPDSLVDVDEVPDTINRATVGYWVWYRNQNSELEHDLSESQAKTVESGKYLFFSPDDPSNLENIIFEEFQNRPFSSAKLPTIPGKKEDWVVCIYDSDDRYWCDLKGRYHNPPGVKFRGFKTNEATRQGEYSERFTRES